MKNVQDIYPVSPMQEFMLLHGLSNAKSDTLFNQFVFSVSADLETEAFKQAWSQVIASHAALRTGFIWQGVETPQQVVRQSVKLQCETIDLEALTEQDQARKLERILRDDRSEGFDFRRAPLMRFKLVRLAPAQWRVVWSSHHLILDRWCIDVLIVDFQRHYAHYAKGSSAPAERVRSPSYRDYIVWLNQQDRKAAFAHWRQYLEGFDSPVSTGELAGSDYLSAADVSTEAVRPLGQELTRKVRAFAGTMGITVSCVVQAALAIAVNRIAKRADVVFGVTVAGRPAAISHVEDIIGSFINTIPVRVTFGSDAVLGDWLKKLNGTQFANAQFDYLSPAQLRTCAEAVSNRPLFDILVVWLTQTDLEAKPRSSDELLPLVAASEQYATAYPLTLSVVEKIDELVLRGDAAQGQNLPLHALLEVLEDTALQLVESTAEAGLHTLQGVTLLRSQDASNERSVRTVDSNVFEASRSAGLATVKGREDARLDVVEDLLRGEWKEVLGLSGAVTDDNDFFEIGGDSLKAATLHTRIESATRKAIPLLALFERSTLTGMAQTLVDEKWPLRAGIVMPLRVNNSRPPLFCVASPEVNTIGYAILTRHLDERYNLVLLQAPPDSEDLQQLHPDDLADMASQYVEALKTVQPAGPYSFLSMCSGSHIALNMVQQLERSGEDVGFFGVVNTWSLYSVSWRFYVNRFMNVAEYYAQRLKQVLGQNRSTPASGAAAAAVSESSVKASAASSPVRVLPADSAVGLDNPWIKQVGLAGRMPAGQNTRVPVSVFRLARQPFWRTGERELGWRRLAGSARAIDLPGNDHDSILREPQVVHIASAIEGELVRVESGPASQNVA